MGFFANLGSSIKDIAGDITGALGMKTNITDAVKAAAPKAVASIASGIKVATGQQSLSSAIKTQLTGSSSGTSTIKTAAVTPSPTPNNTFLGSTSGLVPVKSLTPVSSKALVLPTLLQGSSTNVDNPIKQSLVGASNTTKTVNGPASDSPNMIMYFIGGLIMLVLLFFGFGKRRR